MNELSWRLEGMAKNINYKCQHYLGMTGWNDEYYKIMKILWSAMSHGWCSLTNFPIPEDALFILVTSEKIDDYLSDKVYGVHTGLVSRYHEYDNNNGTEHCIEANLVPWRKIEDRIPNTFWMKLLNEAQSILHNILSYLPQRNLETLAKETRWLETIAKDNGRKSISYTIWSNAAKSAFEDRCEEDSHIAGLPTINGPTEGEAHDEFRKRNNTYIFGPEKVTKRLLHVGKQKPRHPDIIKHLKSLPLTPLDALREMYYGPTAQLPFNKLGGWGFAANHNPDRNGNFFYIHHEMHRQAQHSFAISSRTISKGMAYVEYHFPNLGGRFNTDDALTFQVGVVRPLSIDKWEQIMDTTLNNNRDETFRTICDPRSRQFRQIYNTFRTTQWKGHVDQVLFNPRNFRRRRDTLMERHASVTVSSFQHRSGGEARKYNKHETLGEAYCAEHISNNGISMYNEKVILLLDLEKGTLEHYHRGLRKRTIAKELKGEYAFCVHIKNSPSVTTHHRSTVFHAQDFLLDSQT